MRWLLTVTTAALLIAAVPARSAEPRQPTASWVVNFDNAQCVASRNYGTAQEPLQLVLKASPLGDVMQLAILRKGKVGEASQFDAKLKVDDQPVLRASILVYKSETTNLNISRINLRANEFAPFRQARRVAVRSPGLDEAFVLSNMGPLLLTMDECLIGLRKLWNIAEPTGTQSGLKERAKANLALYVNNNDYPSIAINQDQSGTVAFALLVDEAGKVADCTVIETSGAAALDSQSCGILERRAKFTPAIGADGRAARDAVISRIRWVIPSYHRTAHDD